MGNKGLLIANRHGGLFAAHQNNLGGISLNFMLTTY